MNELEVISKILCDHKNILVLRKEDITRWICDTNNSDKPLWSITLREDYTVRGRPDEIIFETLSGEFKFGSVSVMSYNGVNQRVSFVIREMQNERN